MVDDEELDKFVEGELQKDITQEDKIDPSVEQHLGEMGFLWDRVQQKFKEDKTCFSCKTEMEFEKDATAHLVEASKVEKGVIAFVAVCDVCFEENEQKNEVKKK